VANLAADVQMPMSVVVPTIEVGATPLAHLSVADHRLGTTARIGVKLECLNRTGSVKDRTAVGLLQAMHRQAPLRAADVVVESTSGNLGIAMASILVPLGCRFIAVIDPNIPPDARRELIRLGAEIQDVTAPDANGGYLLNRLHAVEALCAANPHYRWTNQYGNPANSEIHLRTTGPELVAQAPDLDAVYVAVSTGGTLAGISGHLRTERPAARIVAVDAEGSIALGGVPRQRLLSGIGASRASVFLSEHAFDAVVRIADAPSFAMCRALRAQTGVALGGSSGSVLTACVAEATAVDSPARHPVCLAADGGRNYARSLFDDAWLAAKGVLTAVRRVEDEINARFSFAFEPQDQWEDLVSFPALGES